MNFSTNTVRRAGAGSGWSHAVLVVVVIVAAVIYLADLPRNELGNTFYATAVKSGTLSWKAFFFASFDPGSFISVDKPPLAFWVQALSARVFGFSSWSILAPQAIAGVGSVIVLNRMVRNWLGDLAGLIAAGVLALTPVAAMMFRLNNPDGILTLLLLLAAWALWTALRTGRTRLLVLAGATVGFAFEAKMLQAFLVVPVFLAVYLLFGPGSPGRRVAQSALAAATTLVCAGWWIAAVQLWPVADRPWVGGTSQNSEVELAFGYNGLGRFVGAPNASGNALVNADPPGLLRLFDGPNSVQIGWLLPFALVAIVAGIVWRRRAPRHDWERIGFLFWGEWLAIHVLVFSAISGLFHSYYSVVIAPAVAALIAGGGIALVRLGEGGGWRNWLLPAAIAGSAIWAAVILGRIPSFAPGLAEGVVAVGVTAGVAFGVCRARGNIRLAIFAASAAAIALVAGPAALTILTVVTPLAGGAVEIGSSPLLGGANISVDNLEAFQSANPTAALFTAQAVAASTSDPSTATADAALVRYLERHQRHAKFLVATTGAYSAEPLILQSDRAVMTIGGYDGLDPTPSLSAFIKLARSGQVRYALIPPIPPYLPWTPRSLPVGSAGVSITGSAIDRWIVDHGSRIPPKTAGGATNLYRLNDDQ